MNATLARLNRLTADPHAGDGPLLDAFLAGDQAAFAALVRRHADLVFATCRRVLRHQQDAEDAFQATFLVLARRAADVWPREAVGAWLFGVARRVALKARAVRGRRASREHALEDVPVVGPPQPDFDLPEAVHRAVCRLPEVYRAAVVACDLEGLSRKEAAERLGWSEGTLSGRLARARELLAGRFRRLGLALPAGGLAAACVVPETVSATNVQSTIDLATGTAGAASAPVAALTEGVVRSMVLFKLKTLTAAVLAACAIGFGALAASGHGDGSGEGQPGPKAPIKAKPTDPGADKGAESPKANPPKGPRTELARRELEAFLQDVELMALAGKLDGATLDRIRARLGVADRLLDPSDLARETPRPAAAQTDRDRFQGKWQIVALTEGGKTTLANPKDPWVVEVASRTIRMQHPEGGRGGKPDEYVFNMDERASPRTIELIAPNGPSVRGIYEFTAPAATCTACHKELKERAAWAFIGQRPPTDQLAPCGPGLETADLGVRLAWSTDGARPTKFGGPRVGVLELRRPADPTPPAAEHDPALAVNELARAQLEVDAARLEAKRARDTAAAAQAAADRAAKNLKAAQDRVRAAEKAVLEPEPPKPEPAPVGAPAFTVYVRTLTSAEKVIRVKATGGETVLEGLVHAVDDVSIKSDALNVWVVRDGTVMSVDLPAITKNGDAKTNYVLKAGDRLFVQVKAGK